MTSGKSLLNSLIFLSTIASQFFSLGAFAHSGGLDSNGGHQNKKTGQYHCHRAPCSSAPVNGAEIATREAETQGRAFSYVYRREDWKHWSDLDRNCINTRHEILKAQADGPVRMSPDGCHVSSSVWDDPYSGKRITRASEIDIDHVVPLKWAHEHGGANWPASKKEKFANDPDNLLAVDDNLNQQKGAFGPDAWMPPNQGYRCEYVRHWGRVLKKYQLNMTASEVRVFNRQEDSCK